VGSACWDPEAPFADHGSGLLRLHELPIAVVHWTTTDRAALRLRAKHAQTEGEEADGPLTATHRRCTTSRQRTPQAGETLRACQEHPLQARCCLVLLGHGVPRGQGGTLMMPTARWMSAVLRVLRRE